MVFIQFVVFSIPVVRLWDKKTTHDSLKKQTIFIVWFCETRSNLPLSVFFDIWTSRLNINVLSIWVRPLIVKISHEEHYRTTKRNKTQQKTNENEKYSNKRKFIWSLLVLKKWVVFVREKNYLVCMLWPVIQTILYYIWYIYFNDWLYVVQEKPHH